MNSLKFKIKSLLLGFGTSVLAMSLSAKDALAQVPPGGQPGLAIDPLEANVPIVDDTAVRDNLANFNVWVNSIFTILSGVAFAFFIYNVIRFALAKGPDSKDEARQAMIQGIIAVVAIVGIWGIVAFISSTLGIGVGGAGTRPAI